jgi:tetratricopeptide (TPR) repeat protein
MPRQNLQGISHSSLTNHRIIAYAGEPFPDAAFHMTTPNLRDLVYLDQEPGRVNSSVDPLVLLQAYRDLLRQHPEYRDSEIRLLDALMKAQPDNPQVLSALGERAMLTGTAEGLAEAQKDLGRAIAEGSTSASDFDLYARLLISSGAMGEAVDVLKRDIALYPYLTERYKMLAFAYLKLHEYDLALKTMKEELRLFPQDSDMRKLVAHVQNSLVSSPP